MTERQASAVIVLLAAILFVLIGGTVGVVSMVGQLTDTVKAEVRGAVPFKRDKP